MASSVSKPVIGITTYLEQAQCGVWDVRASFLPEVYFSAVTRAGGVAVLLPPQPSDVGSARDIVSRLDGLIVTGGKDVDPARYGQEPHPTTDEPRRDRDVTGPGSACHMPGSAAADASHGASAASLSGSPRCDFTLTNLVTTRAT